MLVAAALAGCRTTGSQPEATKPSENTQALCRAYTEAPGGGSLKSRIHAWYENLAAVAPPDGMSERARTGMRLLTEMRHGTSSYPRTRDDVAAVQDFHAYATTQCGNPAFRLIAEDGFESPSIDE